jgi:Ser/Thr protein kinase RdoA (MazF antagonist)
MSQPLKDLPVIYSMFHVQALAAMLEGAYGLSAVRCQLIKGTVRATYDVTSSDAKYILCIYRHNDRTAAEIEAEIQVIDHLAARGVPVPPAQKQLNSESILAISAPEGDRYAVLFTYIPGQQLSKQPDSATVREIGRVLAELHQAADELPKRLNRPAIDFTMVERAVSDFADAAPERVDDIAYLRDVAEMLRTRFASLSVQQPAYGLIHGDVIPSNVQVSEDGKHITLLDFDFCGYGWRMMDVANFLAEADYWKMGDAVRDAFVEGYAAIRGISDAEYATIPLMQIARMVLSLGTPARHINTWGRGYFSDMIINRQIELIQTTVMRLH